MDEAFIGSIVLFAGNFAPKGWAFCDGSLLNISQNSALYSILGTYYGGNGTTTFALPDLRGRVPVHSNNGQAGPGQQPVQLGQSAGNSNVTLLSTQMPAHTHALVATSATATVSNPSGNMLASSAGSLEDGTATIVNEYAPAGGNVVPMAPTSITPSGGNQPFSVMQPYLGLNYIICLYGLYPSRN